MMTHERLDIYGGPVEMKMQLVTSSNIQSVGYDEQTSVLVVEFHSGRTY